MCADSARGQPLLVKVPFQRAQCERVAVSSGQAHVREAYQHETDCGGAQGLLPATQRPLDAGAGQRNTGPQRMSTSGAACTYCQGCGGTPHEMEG